MYAYIIGLLAILSSSLLSFSPELVDIIQSGESFSFSDANLKNKLMSSKNDSLIGELIFYNSYAQKLKLCLYSSFNHQRKYRELIFSIVLNHHLPCKVDKPVFKLSEIFNLKVNFTSDKRLLEIFYDREKREFILNNLGDYPHKPFQSAIRARRFQGVKILSKYSFKQTQKSLLKGQLCKKVNNKCQVIFDYCDQCENKQSYEFMDGPCTKNYSKRCGADLCGSKNEVACVRGLALQEHKTYCVNESSYGICSERLRVMCENRVLVCK